MNDGSKPVLVTGALGQLGKRVCALLLPRGSAPMLVGRTLSGKVRREART
jgi:uncharacterized protein YbjT (DUF2867 family)